MENFDTLSNRVHWTRAWLTAFTQREPVADMEDYEVVDHSEAESTAFGIESIHDEVESVAGFSDEHEPVALASHAEPVATYALGAGHGCTAAVADSVDGDSDGDSDAPGYELAGRGVEQPFRDLRSAGHARGRRRADREKYFGFRAVHKGQLGQPHHDLTPGRDERGVWTTVLPADTPIVEIDKRALYHLAQAWPRPPRYHRRSQAKDRYPWEPRVEVRQSARKYRHRDLAMDVVEARSGGWDRL